MTRSEHLDLELAHAVHAGHRPGQPPPLEDGDPVPGCDCATCTGSPSGPRRRRRPRSGPRDGLPVEAARRMPIEKVVRRLDLGDPADRWGEPRIRCPFHDDHDPSLRLDVADGLWYCDPCGIGGDGIELWRRVRGVDFAEAVHEMAGVTP